MPILPAVGLGVRVDWAKENGKYDAVKTTGGNIAGSMIDAKTGGGLVTPYLRELGTNVFDRYYDSLKKENNNEKK